MIDSLVLYCGALATAAGAAMMLSKRHRRRGAAIAGAGALAAIAALLWPVREDSVTTKSTHLDELVPVWQFDELHSIDVSAPPDRVFDAIRHVTAAEIPLFRTLTAIRRGGVRGRESIVNAPPNEPILAVATRTSFRYLADDPPRELVVGTRIGPSTVAVMNFLVVADGHGGSTLTTETRVHARSPSGRRAFAVYWRLIHPGSDLIRRMWLRAIRKRAEQPHSG